MSRSIVRRWWKWGAAVVLVGSAVWMFARSGASNAAEAYDLVIANGE